ncbi:hypothetical protein K1T71_001532 [Dendrolimus kikuchii]|uniref:Uncharacterized protein n=1 Tax=Dendrolimus kikuchii TaxID=765133 RepID=A0ACC1DJK5_9NEOP|nr:hypothetical protein K1T71_001532 [Dendrolimus kikuchii]
MSEVNLDTILLEVGQFGKYQMRTAALCAVLVIFVSWSISEYVFTTSRINSRCFIPECESEPSSADYAPEWILNAVPGTDMESFDNCQRYVNTSAVDLVTNGTCPDELFDRSTLQNCEEYVYENKYSVVYDFDLACDEWRRTLIGTIRTIGTLPAFPLAGFMSDRWGRKTAMLVDAFNMLWLGTVRYWVNSYIGFTILQFFEAVFSASCHSCAYILMRWYLSKGKFEESAAMLRRMAQVNGTQLSDSSLEALKKTAEEDIKRKAKSEQAGENEPWVVVEVFKHKKILLRCATSPIWWIACTMIYYGLNINSVNILGGNQYVNYMIVAAAEIPGYWAAMILLGKIGRRPVLAGGFWICSICMIAFAFIPSDLYALGLTVYLIGTICIAGVFSSIYVYTAELYPTPYRHRLFAFSSMLGRFGNIIAPLTPAIGAATFDGLPFIIFGGLAFISGFLILLLPETLGITLPETMEEASNIGCNNKTETIL